MITPEELFHQRRKFLALGVGAMISPLYIERLMAQTSFQKPLDMIGNDLSLTQEKDATSYNNFYEFGFDKSDPKKRSSHFSTKDWKISISGAVKNPIEISMDTLLSTMPIVKRVYRLRCVEAWGMVIPWMGFELRNLLDLVQPNKEARFVKFSTLYDPSRFPQQKALFTSIDFPYTEGLRLDEANHPLTLLAVGMYDKPLLPQNGAPIRLVVPWKYGFKSIKSIDKIELLKEQPISTWEKQNPREYGFYANVDPLVPHPRWSQASERIIGERGRRETLYLNGYEKEVGHLYANMDRKKLY